MSVPMPSPGNVYKSNAHQLPWDHPSELLPSFPSPVSTVSSSSHKLWGSVISREWTGGSHACSRESELGYWGLSDSRCAFLSQRRMSGLGHPLGACFSNLWILTLAGNSQILGWSYLWKILFPSSFPLSLSCSSYSLFPSIPLSFPSLISLLSLNSLSPSPLFFCCLALMPDRCQRNRTKHSNLFSNRIL